MKLAITILLLIAVVASADNVGSGGSHGSSSSSRGQKNAMDIVFIIDEGTMYTQQIQSWLVGSLPSLEQFLSVNQQTGPQNANRYGLVLFGGSNLRAVSIMGKKFVSSEVFLSNINQQFSPTESGHFDGYAAINLALDLQFRPTATPLFILVTPRYREIVNQDLTRNMILNKLKRKNVLLNVIVNTTFVITDLGQQMPDSSMINYTRAVGILFNDKIRDTYYINENNVNENNGMSPMGYSMNGRIDASISTFTVVDDYVYLAEELARETCDKKSQMRNRLLGAAFDIKYIIENTFINLWNQLFNMILNLEVSISQGVHPLPSIPTTPTPTPQPSPIVSGCPLHSTVFGERLFFALDRMVSEQQARQECENQGGYLANVTEENSAFLAQFTSNQTFIQTLPPSQQVFWINSWDGDNYGGAVIVFFRGAISTPVDANELHYALCELPTVPQQCSDQLRG